jgi:hypothetical protein
VSHQQLTTIAKLLHSGGVERRAHHHVLCDVFEVRESELADALLLQIEPVEAQEDDPRVPPECFTSETHTGR